MKFFLHWVVQHFLFAGTLFFAAGAPAITDSGAGAETTTGGESGGAADLGYGGEETTEEPTTETIDAAKTETTTEPPETKEEPELAEFKGAVSARLRSIVKQAPELTQVFQKYPKLQEQIEATFRREAALREVFPTVAEARQMRDHFPNGLSDVQQLLDDQAEVDQLDQHFYTKDRDGNYAGHATLLNNMFQDDRQATVALFRNLPKEWARLDRDSYNEVMGNIVGATLAQRGIPEYIAGLIDVAKSNDQKQLAGDLEKLLGWAQGFTREKARPSAEEERLAQDRKALDREKHERSQQDGQRFHNTFIAQSRKLQLDVIQNHPAMKRLEKVPGITPEKRARIADDIRGRMEKLLGKSPSFMRKLRPAYDGRNLDETLKLQRAAWSQQWLLNKMVREVLRVETPAMVQNNREAAQRRAGTTAKVTPKAGDAKSTPKGPRQVGGRWYREDGRPFTTQEVLAGKHLSA